MSERLENIFITELKGIGDKKASLLAKLGIFTVWDMLCYFPRGYRDYSRLCPCAALTEGDVSVIARIAATPCVNYIGKGKSIVSAVAHDETGRVHIQYYNQPYRKNSLSAGDTYLISGKAERTKNGFRFVNPETERAGEGAVKGIAAVYPLTAGVSQSMLRGCARMCVSLLEDAPASDDLPLPVREKLGVCGIGRALRQIHFPDSMEEAAIAKKRVVTEQALYYMLVLEMIAEYKKREKGIRFVMDGLIESFCSRLPFELTGAQMRTLREISSDMSGCDAMNRLVQGDVGSGKTAAALFMLYAAVKNGYQGALMAPTEVLARQHFNTVSELFPDLKPCLIVGSLSAKERRAANAYAKSGECGAIIGTHALFQDKMEYFNLGAVITDEQHRFGVRQRAMLSAKGETPDTLIMSATPIPRTLTLMLYGDLDVSVIDELPPGRKPVRTAVVPEFKRADMYEYVRKQSLEGVQTYIVCPLIGESDAMDSRSAEQVFFELSQGALKDVPMALLHGRMSGDEKNAVLDGFKSGKTAVLVATTVIEVGVDVPNASIMIIEDSERFGLAQLHQLRGRLGRCARQSYCFLTTGNDEENKRLKTLCETSDGFKIAQKDLELRGPGEFLGKRQSGEGDFKYELFVNDVQTIKKTQELARAISSGGLFPEYRAELMRCAAAQYADRLKDITFN